MTSIYIKDYDTTVNIPEGSDMEAVKKALAKQFPPKSKPAETQVPEWGRENPNLYGVAGAAKETLSPVAEALGLAGGALAGGGPANPAGAVVGAGLGYGLAKRGERWADIALGNKKPDGVVSQVNEGLKNVGTGAAIEAGGQLAGKAIETALPALKGAAEKLYGSATKMPLSKKWVQTLPGKEVSDRQAAIGAGLENKVYSSAYGISKAKNLEKQTRGIVDDVINRGSLSGETAPTEEIIQKGLAKAFKRASKSSDPVGAKAIVENVAEKFRAHGDTIKLSDLNDIKRQLYDEVKWGGSEQTALVGQITTMGKKGLAKSAKEYMEQLHPELKSLNQKDAAYIKLTEALERAVGREQNKDVIGLAAKALAVRSIPMAIFESTLGHPYMKQSLAFALIKASKMKGSSVKPLVTSGAILSQHQEAQ